MMRSCTCMPGLNKQPLATVPTSRVPIHSQCHSMPSKKTLCGKCNYAHGCDSLRWQISITGDLHGIFCAVPRRESWNELRGMSKDQAMQEYIGRLDADLPIWRRHASMEFGRAVSNQRIDSISLGASAGEGPLCSIPGTASESSSCASQSARAGDDSQNMTASQIAKLTARAEHVQHQLDVGSPQVTQPVTRTMTSPHEAGSPVVRPPPTQSITPRSSGRRHRRPPTGAFSPMLSPQSILGSAVRALGLGRDSDSDDDDSDDFESVFSDAELENERLAPIHALEARRRVRFESPIPIPSPSPIPIRSETGQSTSTSTSRSTTDANSISGGVARTDAGGAKHDGDTTRSAMHDVLRTPGLPAWRRGAGAAGLLTPVSSAAASMGRPGLPSVSVSESGNGFSALHGSTEESPLVPARLDSRMDRATASSSS